VSVLYGLLGLLVAFTVAAVLERYAPNSASTLFPKEPDMSSPNHNRATSVYTVTADVDLDQLVQRCPVPLAGSGTNRSGSFIRFRAADDGAAKAVATEAVENSSYHMTTGYGVSQREV
jgi:hypothetical protein